jgi:hypothetical protein
LQLQLAQAVLPPQAAPLGARHETVPPLHDAPPHAPTVMLPGVQAAPVPHEQRLAVIPPQPSAVVPLQSVPVLQPQLLATQACPLLLPAQLVVQTPQWAASFDRSTSQPFVVTPSQLPFVLVQVAMPQAPPVHL